MKLIHRGFNLEMTLQENQITVLSIENPQAYSRILYDIWNQIQGGEGELILSEEEKIKNISKEMDCIFNPFSLDCNDKRVISRLYQELREQAEVMLVNESAMLNRKMIEFMDKLLIQVPYSLEYNPDFDVVSLLKLYGVKIETTGESLLERIVEYIKVMNRICNIRSYVFVGLKQYLTGRELEQLYEFIFYEKIHLIIIESIQSQHICGEKNWILDKDLCIIDL